jgi:hypothetical protein
MSERLALCFKVNVVDVIGDTSANHLMDEVCVAKKSLDKPLSP